ncbi:MAG: phage replisome organizer N-terminal domain-containing protein [Bacillota bacterium]
MADNKKYYYLKLKETFFDSDEMKMLEAGENGYIYLTLYLKMCLISLKFSGELLFREGLPYDAKMLSVITRITLDNVKIGLKVLENFGLIERFSSGAICIMDIEKLIGKSSTEAERVKNYRDNISLKKREQIEYGERTNVHESHNKCNENEHQRLEIRDKRLEIREEEEKEEEKTVIDIDQNQIKNIYKIFQSNIQSLTPIIAEKLEDDINNFSETWVCKAIEVAAERGKRSYAYINGVLNGWRTDGFDIRGEPWAKQQRKNKKAGDPFAEAIAELEAEGKIEK